MNNSINLLNEINTKNEMKKFLIPLNISNSLKVRFSIKITKSSFSSGFSCEVQDK